MKKIPILLLILAFAFPSILGEKLETSHNKLVIKESIQPKRKKKKKRERHIWQKNSQRQRSFLCRDGAVSHSKRRRGACSGHGGVSRAL